MIYWLVVESSCRQSINNLFSSDCLMPLLAVDPFEELLTDGFVGFKAAAQDVGESVAGFVFHAAGDDAEVLGDDGDGDIFGIEKERETVGNLGGEALLELGTLGEVADDPRDFGETDQLAARNVADVSDAMKGDEMVLAAAGEGDLGEDDVSLLLVLEFVFDKGNVRKI